MNDILAEMDDGKPYWRVNLVVVWISQFVSMVAFSISLPFGPFYIRELLMKSGGCAPDELETRVKLCAALSLSIASAMVAVMAPIWGMLADRFGRKQMLIRANFGAGTMLFLMSFAPNVEIFLLYRGLQGIFSGTNSAALTMVSGCTPRSRQGFALGLLTAAIYSGDMTGQFIGGILAEKYGYQMTFTTSALILAFSAFLVLFLAKEDHIRVIAEKASNAARGLKGMMTYVWPCMPIYAVILLIGISRIFDNSQFPLLVELLNGGKDVPGKEVWTGRVAGLASIGAMASGIIIGRLIDRFNPAHTASFAALGAGLSMLAIGLLPFLFMDCGRLSGEFCLLGHSFRESVTIPVLTLMPLRFIMVFCSAGLEPVTNVWLSKITQAEHRGIVLGWAVTARYLGSTIGPMTGGFVSMTYGVRALYFVGPWLLLLLVPLFQIVQLRLRRQFAISPK